MATITEIVAALVEDYRDRCLWFLRPDYMPKSHEEILQTLTLIKRYGDRSAYQRAEEISSWLSQSSRQES